MSKVDLFISLNMDKFDPIALQNVKCQLEEMSEDSLMMLNSLNFQSPTIMFVIAFFLGWERLFLDDIGLGILKILTCYGFGIWWLVDLFTVHSRTKQYNYKKLMGVLACTK